MPFKIKPDVSVYTFDPSPNLMDSSSAEIFIKFKWDATDNPFCSVHDIQQVVDGKIMTVKSFLHETKAADDT